MKVLIIHNKYIEAGGEDTTALNEFNLLKEKNITSEIFYFDNKGSKISAFIKFLAYPFNILSYLKMRRLIRLHKPDLVHIHNFFYAASPSIFYALKHKKVPFLVTVQNFRLLCPSGALFWKGGLYLKSLKKSFTLEPVIDKVYKNSAFLTFWLYMSNYLHFKIGTWSLPSKYIFVSKFSKDIYSQNSFSIYKDKFALKYNFMSVPENNVPFARDKYFVYIGRLSEEKGIQLLLESFSKLPLKLLIIGDGCLKNDVLKYARIYPNIQFLGFKPKDEVLKYLAAAQALIFTSLWYEGMPLTIVESFSVGTPVISSNLGAMSEMIIDKVNGYHFEAGDGGGLIEKVNLVNSLSDEEYWSLVSSTKKDFGRRFSMNESYKTLLDIYSGVLNQ